MHATIQAEPIVSFFQQVFKEWQDHKAVYGDVEALCTELFLNPMNIGDEVPPRNRIRSGEPFVLLYTYRDRYRERQRATDR